MTSSGHRKVSKAASILAGLAIHRISRARRGKNPANSAADSPLSLLAGGPVPAQPPRGLLFDPVGGGGAMNSAPAPEEAASGGGRAVLQPVVRVQARFLVGAQPPVGVVYLGRVVDVALVMGPARSFR